MTVDCIMEFFSGRGTYQGADVWEKMVGVKYPIHSPEISSLLFRARNARPTDAI